MLHATPCFCMIDDGNNATNELQLKVKHGLDSNFYDLAGAAS